VSRQARTEALALLGSREAWLAQARVVLRRVLARCRCSVGPSLNDFGEARPDEIGWSFHVETRLVHGWVAVDDTMVTLRVRGWTVVNTFRFPRADGLTMLRKEMTTILATERTGLNR